MVGTDFFSLMSQFGFPIAVSVYLLITRDKIIAQNTEALKNLKIAIDKFCKEK